LFGSNKVMMLCNIIVTSLLKVSFSPFVHLSVGINNQWQLGGESVMQITAEIKMCYMYVEK